MSVIESVPTSGFHPRVHELVTELTSKYQRDVTDVHGAAGLIDLAMRARDEFPELFKDSYSKPKVQYGYEVSGVIVSVHGLRSFKTIGECARA
jgi:hypothetical protein